MSIRTDIEIYAGDLSEFTDEVIGQQLAQGVNSAFHRLPDQIMLENSFIPIQLWKNATQDFTTPNLSGKSVIYVTRYDASGKARVAIEVNPTLFDEYTSTGSIYTPTKENPIYSIRIINSVPVLNMLPAITGERNTNAETGYVYWKPTHSNLQEYLDSVQITNFPAKALLWTILNTAMRLLGLKLNSAALEEEDTELVQLITAALQTNKGLLDSETRRLGVEESSAFNDQAVQQIENPTKGKPYQR